jgi:hypothetical protein
VSEGDRVPAGDGEAAAGAPEHGPLYYVCRNLGRILWSYRAVRGAVRASPFVLLPSFWLGRAFLQPYLVALRRSSPQLVALALSVVVVAAAVRLGRGRPGLARGIAVLVAAAWIGLVVLPVDPFREMSLYAGYRSLDRRVLARLPLTDDERVYPLAMIARIVGDRLTESHFTVSRFELMRRGRELYWVAQKTPSGNVNRLSLEPIPGLIQVPASATSVDIRHIEARFAYGRDVMWFQELARYVLPRRLSFVDLFDKEIDPDDVTYMIDDSGNWVQVVAVIDWDGVFPAVVPRFAGVFVCPQEGRGDIQFLAPDRIAAAPFLQKQNLLPEVVSSFYAEAWKFNQGLSGWLRNRGVTKITTVPEDANQQPFTVHFRDVDGNDGLYQFFALEPAGPSSGLSRMLLFEPWGHRREVTAYVYDFEERRESLVGPARIAETIKGSDLHADWKQKTGGGTFVIAESRPYIKERGGRRTFRWFNSIITDSHGSNLPIVVLADPRSLRVEWYEGDRIKALLDE